MKSQLIKIRNLPIPESTPSLIHVKPTLLLIGMAVAGLVMVMTFFSSYLGSVLLAFSLFVLWVIPDRILMQCSKEYAVLFNQRDRTSCYMVYWEDVVNWQYEYHVSYDKLVLFLTDGSMQSVDMYSKKQVSILLNRYIPDKEIRNIRRKEQA